MNWCSQTQLAREELDKHGKTARFSMRVIHCGTYITEPNMKFEQFCTEHRQKQLLVGTTF